MKKKKKKKKSRIDSNRDYYYYYYYYFSSRLIPFFKKSRSFQYNSNFVNSLRVVVSHNTNLRFQNERKNKLDTRVVRIEL